MISSPTIKPLCAAELPGFNSPTTVVPLSALFIVTPTLALSLALWTNRCASHASATQLGVSVAAAGRWMVGADALLLPRAEPGRLSDKPLRLSGIVEGDSQFQRA